MCAEVDEEEMSVESLSTFVVYQFLIEFFTASVVLHWRDGVIGIGAGAATDGQVLVLQDMLNIPPGKKAKFVKNYMAAAIANGGTDVLSAVELAVKEIKNGDFPSAEYSYN